MTRISYEVNQEILKESLNMYHVVVKSVCRHLTFNGVQKRRSDRYRLFQEGLFRMELCANLNNV